MHKLVIYFLIIVLTLGCSDSPALPSPTAKTKKLIDAKSSSPSRVAAAVYYVQPFSDIPTQQSNYVFNELKRVYPTIRLLPVTKLPQTAYYKPRNRFRADSLIHWLSQRT